MKFSTLLNQLLLLRGYVLVPMLALVLSACGGGGSSSGAIGPAGEANGGGSGGSSTGDNADQTVISFGSIMNGSFVAGQADVAVANLSAGGTTEVTVNLVDQNGAPITDTFTVSFTSGCVADGTASLETGINTINGQAQSEYTANGCVGSDEIRATVTVDGTELLAIGTVVIEQESVGAIEFVSADPTQIALQGTGGDETSRLTFRVVGQSGSPLQNAVVNFALNSSTGDLQISPLTDNTAADGLVSTIVSAGTIATSVRVTATEQSTGISTQSSELVVSTGIPDSDSFSISQSMFSPEAFNFDGEEVTITARAADAFNNPVPAGTAISFAAEGGSIDASCVTNDQGACTVIWRSQAPRPAEGRVTILASAIGNESFIDSNGDGRFDDTDAAANTPAFDDIGEAFADENENGVYDLGEFFIDFGTLNNVRDPADGLYNGVLCNATSLCATDQSVTVFDVAVINMAGSTPLTPVLFEGDQATSITGGSTINVANNTTVQVFVRAADVRGNSLPAGTTVTFQVEGAGYSISGATATTIADTLDGGFISVPLAIAANNTANIGLLRLTFTTPKGIATPFFWDLRP